MLLSSKTMATQTVNQTAPEARSGLDPWRIGELPLAPRPRGLQWINAVGPGVIVLGASISSGEFLLGPAAFVKYGLSLLWVVGVAALLQTLLNVELMRYTLATGEPIFTGFMRTRPHATFWAWFYAILYFLQMGWPGWAAPRQAQCFFCLRNAYRALTKPVWFTGSAPDFFLCAGSC